jgi:hypothetical protein
MFDLDRNERPLLDRRGHRRSSLGGFPGCSQSSVTTQRRTRFALRPFAKATAAIDTPGWRQADTTLALEFRALRPLSPASDDAIVRSVHVSTGILSGHDHPCAALAKKDDLAGRLQ